jgi:hypothetical protein
LDLLEEGSLAVVVAPAETGADRELLLLAEFDRLHDRPHAGTVCGHRLFGEDVLARFDGVLEMDRTKTGGAAQQRDVARVDDLLVGVQADEFVIVIDFDLGRDGVDSRQVSQAAGEVLAEGITHRDQFDVRVGRQRLASGSRTATAAADESDLQFVAASGVGSRSD